MWRGVSFVFLLISTSAYSDAADMARVLTPEQLQSLGHNISQADINAIHHLNTEQWSNKLAGLNALQSTWLKHQWLQQLAQLNQVTKAQQQWVTTQLASTDSLTMADPDHPQRQISVIDIANQAKNTQVHWQINQGVVQLNEQWDTARWNWQKLLSTDEWINHKTLNQWFMSLSPSLAEQVAESYRLHAFDLPITTNQVLATLAKKARSFELYEQLWLRPADEFSYQALAGLPAVFIEQQAAQQSILATKNKALQSQAYFLLAARYAHLPDAQTALLKALSQPSEQWQAAAVLGQVRDIEFATQLKANFSQQAPSRFREHGLTMMSVRQTPVEY